MPRVHLYSDLLVGLSCVAISLTLAYLGGRARRDIPLRLVFLTCCLFVIAFGAAHFMEVWTTYDSSVHWLAGYLKLFTAVVSVATALVLPPLVPRTLALVREAKLSDERRRELEDANRELEALRVRAATQAAGAVESGLEERRAERLRRGEAGGESPVGGSAVAESAADESSMAESSMAESSVAESRVARLALAPLVLVVEDNVEMNRLLADTLSETCRVESAFDGAEGVRRAIALKPDLVVSDVLMPGMSGEELVEELRQHEELAAVPILMLTGMADDELRVRLLRAGAQDFLTKPFPPDELLARVENLIAVKRTREMLQEELRSQSHDLTSLAREVAFRRREMQVAIEALSRSNQTLEAVIQASPLAIITLDENLLVMSWNPAAERIFGWTEGEVLGRPLPTVPDDLREEVRRNHRAAVAGKSFSNLETRRRRKDGALIDVSISTAPLRDDEGCARGVVALVADITERQRAEEEQKFLSDATTTLASSLAYETTLQAVAHLAVPYLADYCLVDLLEDDGAIRRLVAAHHDPAREAAWREMQRRFPVAPDSDHTVVRVLRTGRAELFPEMSREVLAGAIPRAEQVEELRQLGVGSAMTVPLVARGRVVGAFSFISAESGRRYGERELRLAEELARRAGLAVDNARLYQRAQEANRAKDEFLATLSHELRTPLTPIIGWVHLLRGPEIKRADLTHGLSVIDKNSQALSRLINDLLDMSAILNNKMRIDRAPVALDSVLQQAVETVRQEAAERRIRVELRGGGEGSPVKVAGDRTRLAQVFWNLLSNAVKFSREGGRVRVWYECDGASALVHVEDEGIGITPEFLPRVFDRFEQEDMSMTKQHGGLGIGLALVRSFVEAHGGTVTAASEGAGRGSRFTVSLPLWESRSADFGLRNEDPAEGSATAAAPSSETPQSAISAGRVLVVEDAPDTLEMLRVLLASRGYEVVACAASAEALGVAGREHFDIIIADIGLPNIDGYELLRRIRRESPHLRDAPALALTGYAAQRDVELALEAGYAAHVAKPFEPAALADAVAELLARRGGGDGPSGPGNET